MKTRDMPDFPEYMAKEPLYDFVEICSQEYAPVNNEISAEPVTTVSKKKKAVAEGGC